MSAGHLAQIVCLTAFRAEFGNEEYIRSASVCRVVARGNIYQSKFLFDIGSGLVAER